MINKDENRNYTVWGMAWLLFFSGVSFFAYIQSFLNIPLNYPIAFVVGVVVCLCYLKYESASTKSIIVNILSICGCIVIATFLHDFSWDGQAYHMEAVWQLIKGWNVYYGGPLTDANTINSIWLNSYPKATWMFGAALYAMTGSLLSCKSYVLILCVANVFLLHNIVRNYIRDKWFGRGVVFSLVANPVVCAQLWSSYLDGALYLMCLALSLVLINIAQNVNKKNYLWLAVLSSSIAYNFKFTSVPYVGLVWLCFITYIVIVNRIMLKKVIVAAIAGSCLGLILIGYNPYITNLLSEGHPFWPVMGTHDLRNVMLPCGNEEFLGQNRLIKLGKSYLGKSSNKTATLDNVEYKIPFTVSSSEIKALTNTDCRIGGFGVWFSGIIILTLIALIISVYTSGQCRFYTGYVCILTFILLSVLINPESWVARYAPQIYIMPIIIAMVLKNNTGSSLKKLPNILLFVIVFNAILILCGSTARQVFNEYSDYRIMKELKNHQPINVWSSGMFDTIFETRFKYYNIGYIKRNEKIDNTDIHIIGVGEKSQHIQIYY